MTLPSALRRLARNLRNRRIASALAELDDDRLADIGLLRGDVHAALARSFASDPLKALNAVCCHWRAFVGGGRPVPGAAACCE